MKNKNKGFTLVELLVVIAILAVLASVSIIAYMSFTEKARKSVDESLCTQYNTLLKVEQANDNDITLSDFIVYIEENGINSNQFKTSSKSYVFAYDKGTTTCVLLDSNSGEVKFPANHKASELWTVYPEGPKLVKGVSHYTLLRSLVLSSVEQFEATEYTFDLNGYLLQVNTPNLGKATAINCTNTGEKAVLINKNNIQNIKCDATVTQPAPDKVAVSTSETDKVLKTKMESITTNNIQDEYFTATYLVGTDRIGNPTVAINPTATSTAATEVLTISNTTFSGVGVILDSSNKYKKVVFDGCTFINLNPQTNPITIKNYAGSVEIKNCKFKDLVRGINAGIPNSGVEYNIHNNTFELNKVITDKGERKDIALQIYPSKSDLKGTFKFENNTINKANAAIDLHDSFVGSSAPATDTIKAFLNTVVVSGNTLAAGIETVVCDPGVSDASRPNLQALVEVLKGKF